MAWLRGDLYAEVSGRPRGQGMGLLRDRKAL